VSEERLAYRFGPLERRGLLGPVSAGQAAVLAVAAILAVVVLDDAPSLLGGLLAISVLAAAVPIALAPVARRSLSEWLPIAVRMGTRRLTGRRRFISPVATAGMRARPHPDRGAALLSPATAHPPPGLRGVRILELPYRGRGIGALCEQRGRRLTAVLACRVAAFSLLDAEAQERRLARWGLVLSGSAGTAVTRVQWVERTAPAQGDDIARWLAAERDPALPPRGTAMVESYLELIASATRVGQEHEILLAVQVDGRRVRERGEAGVRSALIEQTERVAQGLEAAEVIVLGALGPGQLARALRTAFDPFARAELTALQVADPERRGLAEADAWPLGTEERWDHYRTDGAVHATFWISGWPRVDVSPMFMDALLGRSNVVRSVAVTFEPIAPDRSTRDAEAAVTRDRADRELRQRFGQSETARQRQAHDAAARREAELAAGHGEVRLAGFITVSGRDPDDLRRACSEVHDHAARARLELHRCYGQQAAAFTFTLPLCRGLA
jgi:hypothetical protein